MENKKTLDEQLAAVQEDGNAIKYIENPSKAVQLAAVQECGWALQFIKEPSEAVQLAAVKKNGGAIQYIANPSEAMQLMAVQPYGWKIKYIDNPSETVQLAAVRQNGYSIKYIDNPSETVQLAAVRQNGYSIEHIDNPSEVVKLAAIRKHGGAIEYIDNPSETLQLVAVQSYGPTIQHIKNPTEAVKLAAVQQDAFAIKHIKNPSEAITQVALQQLMNGSTSTYTLPQKINNLLKNVLKQDTTKAAYRIANEQMVKALAAIMIKSMHMSKLQNDAIQTFLESNVGKSIISYSLGHLLVRLPNNAVLQSMAKESRVAGLEGVGDFLSSQLLSALLSPDQPMLNLSLDEQMISEEIQIDNDYILKTNIGEI